MSGPPGAADQLVLLERLLRAEAVERGLIGPHEKDKIWPRHVTDCLALVPILGEGAHASVIDVGSGAGLPGLPLALILEGTQVVVLDAEVRKTEFLDMATARLGLDVQVVRSRAEDAAREPQHRDSYDVAVARACAPPPVALELVLPFIRPGGRAVLAVGPSAFESRKAAAVTAQVLAGAPPRLVPLQVPGLAAERWAMVVEKLEQTPDRYPRRAGVPSRRPLGS